MAEFIKTELMLRLERAFNSSDIRTLLLDEYNRTNSLRRVAQSFKVSEFTIRGWFRDLGLHTRSSIPAGQIPQDLSHTDATDYSKVPPELRPPAPRAPRPPPVTWEDFLRPPEPPGETPPED